jgi:hypothetical protein
MARGESSGLFFACRGRNASGMARFYFVFGTGAATIADNVVVSGNL